MCKSFEQLMKDKFQMSSMGELTFFLGLQVKQKDFGIFISQDKYVAKILRKFSLTDGKSASSPIDTEKPLLKDPDDKDVDVHIYRSMIGSLINLTLSRLDIMFAVCACARFKVTPKTVVATSSTKAEYVAVASYRAQVLWIQNQLLDYGRIGKRFLGVETLLFDAMLVQQQVQDDTEVQEDEDDNEKVANLEQDKIAQALEITKLKQRVRKLEKKRRTKHSGLKRLRKRMAESQAKVYHLDLQHTEKVLSMLDTDEAEVAEVEEVLEVVTAAKLMTEVVTTGAPITTAAQVPKPSASRKRRGVVIQDTKETATTSVIVHSEVKSKDKGKGILIEEPKLKKEQVKRREKQDNKVMRYQALKRKPMTEAQARKNMMIYLKNMVGFKMDFFKGMTYNEIRPIFEKHCNSIRAFLKKEEEEVTLQEKRQDCANDDDDDVYTEATPLASKALWKLVKERFESTEPKNFSNDFLLNTFKIMFEKPNVEANMILLVEKKYPLTHFTLKQMLNNVRLEVEEESKMSLELLSHATVVPVITSSFTTTIPLTPPFFNPLPHQATPTTSEATTSFHSLPDFSYVFRFNDRVTNLEKDLSKLKQVDQYAQVISLIPAIMDRYMDNKLGEAIHKAIQSHNAECREEAQAKK
nr:hypothetical protein [Tanacetum cinerariifolium]